MNTTINFNFQWVQLIKKNQYQAALKLLVNLNRPQVLRDLLIEYPNLYSLIEKLIGLSHYCIHANQFPWAYTILSFLKEEMICKEEELNRIHFMLGRALQGLGQFSEAIEALKCSNLENIDLFLTLGNCYQAQKKYVDSITYFLKALAINPYHRNTLLSIALSYKAGEHYNLAISAYNRIPNMELNYKAIQSKAYCQRLMKDYSGALLTYQSYTAYNEEVILSMAHCYFEMGQIIEAIKCAQITYNYTNNLQIRLLIGDCEEKILDDVMTNRNLNKHKQAAQILEPYLQLIDNKKIKAIYTKCQQAEEVYQTIFNMAQEYVEENQHLKAIGVLQNISNSQTDPRVQTEIENIKTKFLQFKTSAKAQEKYATLTKIRNSPLNKVRLSEYSLFSRYSTKINELSQLVERAENGQEIEDVKARYGLM